MVIMLAFIAGLPWGLVIILHREVTTSHPKLLQPLHSETWEAPFYMQGSQTFGQAKKEFGE